MADFTSVVVLTESPDATGQDEPPSVVLGATAVGNILVPEYFQRIYDSTAGYVYYTQDVINPTPASGDTTPNHTNNLVASTHEVIKEN